MILPHLAYLNSKTILLGSASPRRKEILTMLGLRFTVAEARIEEISDFYDVREHITYLCELKAEAIKKHVNDYDLLITADTVVFHQNKIIEKPVDKKTAKEILESLSNKTHEVFSAVLLNFQSKKTCFIEKTEVQFSALSNDFINSYIETKDPYDKAGAYGVQNIGASFVQSIHGCYYNVMGFPANAFCKEIVKAISKGEL